MAMISLKRILVPTDFSKPSASALQYAKALAETFQSTLYLLHVIDANALAYGWMGPEAFLPPLTSLQEEREKVVRSQLEQLLTAAERQRFAAELALEIGSPFLEIIRYAQAQNIDLIVMGTHGRGPIAHMLIGSVAEKVVRKAPCPVLTVRHPEHEFVMP
jgi:nucleotide-binding universal stress UspA family protein